jgi:hypothetical protein
VERLAVRPAVLWGGWVKAFRVSLYPTRKKSFSFSMILSGEADRGIRRHPQLVTSQQDHPPMGDCPQDGSLAYLFPKCFQRFGIKV